MFTRSPRSLLVRKPVRQQARLPIVRAARAVVEQMEDRVFLSGTLDPNFSSDGKQTVNFTGASVDTGSAVAVQKDGKTIIAGTYVLGANSFFAVTRLNVDGSLDTSFTDATTGLAAGRTAVRFGGASADLAVATSVAIQADGKIVVAGYTNTISGVGAVGGNDFAIARFNTNGTLDTSFSGDGRLTVDTGGFDRAFAVTIDANQKIVVAGASTMTVEAQATVIRITSTGGLDSSFNGNGISSFGLGSFPLTARGVAIQSTGKIVIVGQEVDSINGTTNPFALRLQSNGQTDTSFGTGSGGFDSILQLNYPQQAIATSVVVDSSDRIVFGGIYAVTGASDAMAGRLDSAGNIDTSFAFAGPNNLFVKNVLGTDGINSVAIDASNNINLGGFAQGAGNRAMLAIQIAGSGVTTSFNVNGIATVDIAAGDDSAAGIAVQTDGKIILAGSTASGSDMAIAKLTGTGFLAINGTNGTDTISYNGSSYTVNGSTVPIDTSYVVSVAISALGGTDTININSTVAGQHISVSGGQGSNTYNVGGGKFSNLQSDVNINNTVGATETLNIDDHLNTASPGPLSVLESFLYSQGGPPVAYSGMGNVNVLLGTGDQFIQVHGTAAGTTTKVTGNAGVDFYEIGSSNTLSNDLAGPLILDGGAGSADHVSLNNDADLNDDNVTVNGNNVTFAGTSVNVTILGMETVDFNMISDSVKTINASASTLIGTAYHLGGGNDSFTGGAQAEFVEAGAGSDTLHGGSGNDTLQGDDGDDQIFGDAGNDSLLGSFGNDILDGGEGNDLLDGADDSDTYKFSNATAAQTDTLNDVVDGGFNVLDFSAMTNSVTINLGSNTLATMTNRTVNTASAGLFTAFQLAVGGSGADNITGNDLANTLLGGAGNDTITGGKGSDFLRGGLNDDKYIFGTATSAETDSITELAETGNDTLDFSGITTGVTVNLAGATIASHTNRTVISNTGATTNVEIAIGGSGADSLTGSSTSNTLTGNAGNDTLTGGDGSDSLVGGDNNDTYKFAAAGAAQTDTINETSTGGIDTLDFSSLTTAVTINLGATATATHTNRTVNSASGATTNIENATGGNGADSITGSSGNNTLQGNAGNDSLFGLAGDDSLAGGNDIDRVDGGEGSDKLDGDTYVFANALAAQTDTISESILFYDHATLDFTALTVPVTVNMNLATIATHSNRNVVLAAGTSANFLVSVLGGSGNDTITGNNTNIYHREFFGNGGNDSINGGTGNVNYLVGGDGNDTLIGGSTQDNMFGGKGDDSLVGNGGNDFMYGGQFDGDTVAGNDTYDGGEGSDTFFTSPGNTTYKFANALAVQTDQVLEYANNGTDTLDFSAMTNAVTVNLLNSSFATMTNRTVVGLNFDANTNIENIIGGSGNDTLAGNSLNNSISGGAGNDSITGNLGNDTLVDGEGNDTLIGSDGSDVYKFNTAAAVQTDRVAEIANNGTDTLDFSSLAVGVTGNIFSDTLATHTNRTVLTSVAGQFANIENLTGGSAGDTLTGNSGNNVLTGNGGNDSLIGNLGNDSLNGGEGNDTAVGGDGSDTYVFGTASAVQTDRVTEIANNGTDTLDFSGLTTAVTVNLASDTLATHTNRTVLTSVAGQFVNIENATGGSGNDTLTGNTGNNALRGNAGNDSITAGTGNDTLTGGAGNDAMIGGDGNDVYSFGNSVGAEIDTVSEIANNGIDTIDCSSMTTGVTLNLSIDTVLSDINRLVPTLVAGQFANFENATGGSGNDTITGNNSNNTLLGNGGNDSITALLGADLLDGGEGNDTLIGGDGNDVYRFGQATAAQTDVIGEIANNGTDTLDFSLLNASTGVTVNLLSDTLATHTNRTVKTQTAGQFVNIENATGGAGADKLTGNNVANTLIGNAGNDTLTGNGGSDNMQGGNDIDTFFALDGAIDTLDGGAANDILSSADANDVKSNIP